MSKWISALIAAILCITGSVLIMIRHSDQNTILEHQLILLRDNAESGLDSHQFFKTAVNTEIISQFSQSIEELKITLADYFKGVEQVGLVSNLSFSQQEQTPRDSNSNLSNLTVLRVNLNFEAGDEVSAIELLDKLYHSVVNWPIEIVGCQMVRYSNDRIKTSCISDIYHWSLVNSYG